MHPSLTHAVRTGEQVRKESLALDPSFWESVEEIEESADVDANCGKDQLELDATGKVVRGTAMMTMSADSLGDTEALPLQPDLDHALSSTFSGLAWSCYSYPGAPGSPRRSHCALSGLASAASARKRGE